MASYRKPRAAIIESRRGKRPLMIPSAARCRNQLFEIEGGRALSALSPQLLNKFCDFSRFTEQNFFAKRKEVIDKDSILSASFALDEFIAL
jgi:hypothetical protein